MRRRKSWAWVLIAVLVVSLLTGCAKKEAAPEPGTGQAGAPSGEAPSPVELKMVMFLPDVPPGNIWPHMFMDKVKELSKGELVIKLIGGPEAIPAEDAPAATQKGVVDIAHVMDYALNSLVPGIEALGRAEYTPAELRQRGLHQYLRELYAPLGLYYLGAAPASEPQQQTSFYFKEPVRTLADFKGRRIAVVGAAMQTFISALGAVPVPMPFTEYFTAMERGVVDGYSIGTPGILDFGLTPVTGFMLEDHVASCAGEFIVNLDRWNGLPKHLQEVLEQAAIYTEVEGQKKWDEVVADVKARISKEGVEIGRLSPEDGLRFYQIYREKMMEEDFKVGKGNEAVVKKLHEITRNPNFYRLDPSYYQQRK